MEQTARQPRAEAEWERPMGGAAYTALTIVLHWLLAVLIVALFALGWYMVDIPRNTPERAFFYNLHKSIGVTAAVLIALHIGWRATHAPSPLPSSVPQWQARAAHASYVLMYACMVVVPVSGFIESNFTKWGVKFFGLQLPPLGWEDAAIAEVFKGIHFFSSYFFLALVAVHVAAALKHLLVDRDEVFRRMLPRRR